MHPSYMPLTSKVTIINAQVHEDTVQSIENMNMLNIITQSANVLKYRSLIQSP